MTDGIATQLQRRRRIIERPRLTRLLDESPARMKLLVAPAGYGKSTLARQWTADRPRAWYRGSPAAADVASVSRGIAIAAGEVLPGCNARLEERLRITKNPDDEYATLAEMLSRTSTAGPKTPGSSSTTRSSCWSGNRHPSSCQPCCATHGSTR